MICKQTFLSIYKFRASVYIRNGSFFGVIKGLFTGVFLACFSEGVFGRCLKIFLK